MQSTAKTSKPIALVAAVLAWLIPGAGHLYLGRRRRGVVIFLTVGLTFWAGMAMGGAMTLYSDAEGWWFAADMLAGAHGLVAWQHHKHVYEPIWEAASRRYASEGVRPNVEEGSLSLLRQLVDQEMEKRDLALVAPTDTVARAYSGVAGLLNLLCIFDALILALMGERGEPAPSPAGGPAPGSPEASASPAPRRREEAPC
jgi:TM2 domain-containing membrane protein YozV